MSLYTNENGTLKEVSLLDSGSFKITGIDYFGALTPVTSNEFEVLLSKPLGNYKFIIVLPIRIADLNNQGSTASNSGFITVISVSAILDSAATGNIEKTGFATAIASPSTAFVSGIISMTNIKELNEAAETIRFASELLRKFLVEFYGVF